MVIERWTGPPVDTHTYLVVDEPSGEAWAVDAPLDTAARLLSHVAERGLRLTRVVLTHGHFDHLLDLDRYREAGIPLAANPQDRALLDAPQPAYFGLPYRMPRVTIQEEIGEGSRLTLGEDVWEVWHVPGHSPGHVILYCAARAAVLGGDMLFQGGYGRVDLPGADAGDMAASLLRMMALPPETRVYPGHGPDTTIAAEQAWLEPLLTNPRGIRL